VKVISVSIRLALFGAAIFAGNVLGVAAQAQNPLHITHQYPMSMRAA